MLRKAQANLTAGILVVVAVGIPFYIGYRIWDAIGNFAAMVDIRVVKNSALNTAVYVAAFALVTCGIGAIFKFKLFRSAFDWFTAKVPLISTVAKFIPHSDELEILNAKRIIRIKRSPGLYQLAAVTKEWTKDGTKWLRIYVPSYPAAFSGQAFEVKVGEVEIENTDITAPEFLAIVVSYGARSSEHKKTH